MYTSSASNAWIRFWRVSFDMPGALERSGTCELGALSAVTTTVRQARNRITKRLLRYGFIRDPETESLDSLYGGRGWTAERSF
jgi:hypothetical protein